MGAGPYYDFLEKQILRERENEVVQLRDEFEIAFVIGRFKEMRAVFIKAFATTKVGLDKEQEMRLSKVIEDLKSI